MIIRPSDGMGLNALFAGGRFEQADDAFVVDRPEAGTPLGSSLCSLGSGYSVCISPDGAGRSFYGAYELTPIDGAGKAGYLKDVDSGEIWSPAFCPAGEKNRSVQTAYLPGRAVFKSLNHKIAAELAVGVLHDKPCEVWILKLENRSARHRSLSFTTYFRLSAGSGLELKFLPEEKALVGRKALGSLQAGVTEPGRDLVFFHASTLIPSSYEIERADFLGDGGTLRSPRALQQERSGGRDGTAENAIMSLTVCVDLPIEGEAEIGFCFGASESVEGALDAVRSLNEIDAAMEALERSGQHWPSISSTLAVKTPDAALDALVNTWLPYETYAGWAARRTGGVIMDGSQIVDSLRRYHPIVAAVPELCWSNLLSFAARMSSSGTLSASENVRVEPSADELLWLAASTAAYVAETGDVGLLEEKVWLTDGIPSSIGEECERAIRTCLDGKANVEDKELLRRTVNLWSLIRPECPGIEWIGTDAQARTADDTTVDGPTKRIRQLQAICPTLSDPALADSLALIPSTESRTGEMCALYMTLMERLFGVWASIEGLVVRPRLPESWQGFEMKRRFRGDTYHIRVSRSADGTRGWSLVVDGCPVMGSSVPYFGDGGEHQVDVVAGPDPAAADLRGNIET